VSVLVIAGSGRGAGKTAVGCALIAAMPELRWLAVKVSPHAYVMGQAIWEETDRNSEKDTGRYLAAGAERAFLVSEVQEGQATTSVAEARARALECDAMLVESNRLVPEVLAKPGEPTVCLAVLAGPEEEWKASLAGFVGRADAVVLTGGLSPEKFASLFGQRPVFSLREGQWSEPDLLRFARGHLIG
jgi:hypothetical protein